jgi:ADP-ribose pyrophosphatase YjhB (NUDIX family)
MMLEFIAVILGPALAAVVAIFLKLWLDKRRRARISPPVDQVAVLFWKASGGVPQVLLVRTDDPNHERWVLPKGNKRDGESDQQTARRLFGKKAGVTGTIPESPFTKIHFDKDTRVHRVAVFLVRAENEGTPDERWRHPTWFSPQEAEARVRQHRTTGRHIANAEELQRTLREAAAAVEAGMSRG